MISTQCLVNRPEKCKGQVVSLAYIGPCQGPAHDEPVEEDDGLDAHVDLMIERDLEDLHFAEGWT